MQDQLEHIKRAQDLRDADIAEAVRSREATKALLLKLAAVSAPETGAAKVLLLLSRMATTACEWIDGDLAIDLVDEGAATRVEVAIEMGGGLRERLFPTLRLRAPFAEFARAIERVPHLIKPLRQRAMADKRLTLAASAHVRRTIRAAARHRDRGRRASTCARRPPRRPRARARTACPSSSRPRRTRSRT